MAAFRWRYILDICSFAYYMFVFGVALPILKLLPKRWTGSLAKQHLDDCQYNPQGPISPHDFLHSCGTPAAVKYIARIYYLELSRGYVCEGEDVPNLALWRLTESDIMQKCRLLDFMQSCRPLVVNFGSCT